MRSLNSLLLPIFLLALSAATQAADLNGAWTIDASSCALVFKKQNNKLAFRKDADFNAGGLIVQGKQITGTFQKCTAKSLRAEGATMSVVASCSDGVAISDIAFDLRFTGDNAITLSQKEPVPMEISYVRCAM